MIARIIITQAGDPPDDKEFVVDVSYFNSMVGYSRIVGRDLLLRELANILDSKLELD